MTPVNTILIVISIILSLPSYATLHPVLVDPKIKSCSTNACIAGVVYQWGPAVLVDLPEEGKPDSWLGTELAAYGMHCNYGSMLSGVPFSGCTFTRRVGHNPTLLNCRLKNTESWALTPDSTCSTRDDGPGNDAHSGAGPGGECVLFVQAGNPNTTGSLATIHGRLEPNTVANSGNRFCQKPIPPAITCDLSLPALIDHGVVGPNSHSTVSVDGDLACGDNPVVTITSGAVLNLAPGVTTKLTTHLISTNRIRLTSDLRTTAGTPGAHSASVVVLVSPY